MKLLLAVGVVAAAITAPISSVSAMQSAAPLKAQTITCRERDLSNLSSVGCTPFD